MCAFVVAIIEKEGLKGGAGGRPEGAEAKGQGGTAKGAHTPEARATTHMRGTKPGPQGQRQPREARRERERERERRPSKA